MGWFGKKKPENFFIPFGMGSSGSIFNREDPIRVFSDVSLISAIVGTRSQTFADARPYITTKKDGIGDDAISTQAKDLNRIFERANFYMSFSEWYVQKEIIKMLFGYCITYLVRATPASPIAAMFNLLPSQVSFSWKGKMLHQRSLSECVTVKIQGVNTTINPDKDIIIWNDRAVGLDTGNSILSLPRISSVLRDADLSRYISEAEHTLVTKRGAIGIMSMDPEGASQGIFDAEKEVLQDSLKEHGLSAKQSQIFFTNLPLRWHPVTWNAKDLMLREIDEAVAKRVCGVFDVPYYLLPMSGQSTYDNVKQSEVQLYERVSLPTSRGDAATFARAFGLPENEFVYFDYSHVHVLAENMKEKSETLNTMAGALATLLSNNIITYTEARVEASRYMDIEPKKPDNTITNG